MEASSLSKSCLTVSVMLGILSVFCLIFGTPGSAPYILAALSLAVNAVFCAVLLGKRIRENIRRRKESPPREPGNPQNHA